MVEDAGNGGPHLRPDFNKDKEDDEETEGDPFEEEGRSRWQEEEKEPKEAYFKIKKRRKKKDVTSGKQCHN